jgi:uncharacterized protein (DUF1810 family)
MRDPHHLQRFVNAQETVFAQVCSELRAGRKQGHWMWFIFPQLKGLGHREMATRYGIGSQEEAQAYLHHPLLGPRLSECTQIVNAVEGRSIDEILGYPDNLKFRSSMTLFALAGPENALFNDALQKYFGGELDQRTVTLLTFRPSPTV